MENFCQSCGMPMTESEHFGTNKDLSQNNDYCSYCFKEGNFTSDCTMDEMINQCAQFLDEFNKDSEQKFTKEQAIAQMREYFPKLKRWASK
jgi:predicted amidophosphoribosyltransferase